MKSEPAAYSIDDLAREQVGRWDGVRNYQVRNMLRDNFAIGDTALFYHSNVGKDIGVVGVMEIASVGYPDPTQFDPKSEYYDPKATPETPRWYCVDVAYRETFSQPVLLSLLRQTPSLQTMQLLQKGSRLSIVPLTKKQFVAISAMGQ